MNKSIGVLLALFLTFIARLNAQSFEMAAAIGISRPYLIESIEEKEELKIGLAPVLKTSIKFIPESTNNYWGIKLSVQYIETRVEGMTLITHKPINGFLSNTSFFMLFEKVKPFKNTSNIQFIQAYGIGLSVENYLESAEEIPRKNNYASLLLNWGLKFPLSQGFSFTAKGELFASDFIKGIHYLAGNWSGQSAGEDISLNLLFGLDYKF